MFHDELNTLLNANPPTTAPSPSAPSTETSSLSSPPPTSVNVALTADDVRRIITETLSAQTSYSSSSATRSDRMGDPVNRPPRILGRPGPPPWKTRQLLLDAWYDLQPASHQRHLPP